MCTRLILILFLPSLTLTSTIRLDWRQYLNVTRRSNFAFRVFGSLSTGNFPDPVYFGGLDTLRLTPPQGAGGALQLHRDTRGLQGRHHRPHRKGDQQPAEIGQRTEQPPPQPWPQSALSRVS